MDKELKGFREWKLVIVILFLRNQIVLLSIVSNQIYEKKAYKCTILKK